MSVESHTLEKTDMTQRLDLVLALCLILQSFCGVSLQDPSEFEGGLNDDYLDEYITQVPVVGLNDVGEAENDRPAEGGLALGSMMYSGVEDSQTNVSVPTLSGSEGEEPSASSDIIVTLSPMLRSDDSLDVTVEEDASVDLPSTTPEPEMGFNPSMFRDGNSSSVSNEISDANATPEPVMGFNASMWREGDSLPETNSTVSTGTDANSTDITGTDTNSTDVINASSGTNSSNVTNPLNPGPTNPPGVNVTMGGLNPATENPAENTPEPTAENIPASTAEKIPEPTAEYIPATTTESIPEPTPEVIPDDTAPPSGNDTALAKAAAAANAEQGVDSGTQSTNNGRAWGVILGLAVTVGIVGLVMYVLLKRKERLNFSHSKLVEEAPADPVLRLDNGEPLDLKYDGFGYYNPSLQGDDIQMSNFPSGRPR
ncbi:mucin-15 isoform X2 [Alosa sapidissima]|uniref:mucin-15 isoform X2 n=1 Tax=Alosa sapidissima TaxID=34773 RepID=UPI001C09064F|nr:mucin-15 isoform X2 [Alosa sapidissima]